MGFDLSDILPYLEHPLVLVGFFVFLFFSFARYLVSKGIIPPLPPNKATDVLKSVLRYGFIFGVLIILLGFGLQYRELPHRQQERVVGMLHVEFGTNLQVAAELAANTETILGNAITVAESLRHEGIQILPVIFPMGNLENLADRRASVNTADAALRRLEDSGLGNNPEEVRKFHQAGQAISATIERTLGTMSSLADRDRQRYQFTREIWENHLDVLREVEIIDVTTFQQVYRELVGLRNEYDVVIEQCLEYFRSVSDFFQGMDGHISRTELAKVLASERLAFSVISTYGSRLATHSERLIDAQKLLEQEFSPAGFSFFGNLLLSDASR